MHFSKIKMLDEYDKKKKVIIYRVHSDDISQLYSDYMYVVRRVKYIEDEDLEEELVVLKKLFNSIVSSIIPYEFLLVDYELSEISQFFTRLKETDPDEETERILKNLGKKIRSFIEGKVQNNLKKELMALYNTGSCRNKVVLDRYWNNPPKEIKVKRISRYLTDDNYYEKAFYLRSPDYYFDTNTVFKAKDTYYLSYDIFQSKLKQQIVIEGNKSENSAIYKNVEFQFMGSDISTNNKDEFEKFYLDNVHAVKKWVQSYNNKRLSSDVSTSAKLFGITTGEIIFYPINSKVRIINKGELKIEQCESSNIKIDDWLIIKHSSDEEFIKEKARENLGPIYDEMFDKVTAYKKLLEEQLNTLGSLEKLRENLKENDIKVERQVLSSWIFGDTIRPRDYFKILNFFGYSNADAEKLYEYSKIIFAAHQEAGRILGKNIQTIIDNIGIDSIAIEMFHNGRVEFEAENIGKYRIESVIFVNPNNFYIEYGNMYKPIKVSGSSIKDSSSKNII